MPSQPPSGFEYNFTRATIGELKANVNGTSEQVVTQFDFALAYKASLVLPRFADRASIRICIGGQAKAM